mmetsp:Transcript_27435/g.63406  ORF Transcript_27435/g.63406 Transcript_27435/m.63406 type:complete len:459 (-) Transcript_27435:101-1477(-)
MAGLQFVLPGSIAPAGRNVLAKQPLAVTPLARVASIPQARSQHNLHTASLGLVLGASAAARHGRKSKMLVRAMPFRGKKKDKAQSADIEILETEEQASEGESQVEVDEDVPEEHEEVKACPTCYTRLSSGCYCPRCSVGYLRKADGNFIDLRIAAAVPVASEAEAVQKCKVAEKGKRTRVKDRKLSRLPGVTQLDSLAKAVNLPTSSDLEDLALAVAKDADKVIPRGQLQQSTFESPLVSFIYERGWRQQFRQSGFPGPDAEYKLAKGFLLASRRVMNMEGEEPLAGPLLDCSCGSGVFTRRFASDKALPFQRLIALDFSQSMLEQVDSTCSKEAGGADYPEYARPLELIRGDVTRLPLASGALSGIHAGAAIHCWPNPEVAMAELARVLQPGAGLVLSTFRTNSVIRLNRSFRLWKEDELSELCKKVGLMNIKVETREPAFIMIYAEKPIQESDVSA